MYIYALSDRPIASTPSKHPGNALVIAGNGLPLCILSVRRLKLLVHRIFPLGKFRSPTEQNSEKITDFFLGKQL